VRTFRQFGRYPQGIYADFLQCGITGQRALLEIHLIEAKNFTIKPTKVLTYKELRLLLAVTPNRKDCLCRNTGSNINRSCLYQNLTSYADKRIPIAEYPFLNTAGLDHWREDLAGHADQLLTFQYSLLSIRISLVGLQILALCFHSGFFPV
jgi:hypothetical protein